MVTPAGAAAARAANDVTLPAGFGSGGSFGSGYAGGGDASRSNASGGASGTATDDHITVAVVRPATAQLAGMLSVLVPEAVVISGKGFSFPLPNAMAEAAAAGDVRVTYRNGKPLPAWLQYVPATKTFVATAVPTGALPIEALVRIGTQSWRVLITESH